jgi:hypothetical protein
MSIQPRQVGALQECSASSVTGLSTRSPTISPRRRGRLRSGVTADLLHDDPLRMGAIRVARGRDRSLHRGRVDVAEQLGLGSTDAVG